MSETKRKFLKSFGCCICSLGIRRAKAESLTAAETKSEGCIVWNLDVKDLKISFLGNSAETFSRRTTGNATLDLALDRAIKQLADSFNAYPAFGFYDDSDGPNAKAFARGMLPNTTATVLFGERYFQKWMQYDPVGVTVLTVIAHEFGHVLQFSSGEYRQIHGDIPTVKRVELHADYMAGFYIGLLRKQNQSASFWKAGDSFRLIGNYDDQSPYFHGTPEDRVAASNAGFQFSFVQGRDAHAAFQAGMNYVSNL